MSETLHQQALFQWARMHVSKYQELELLHAIPNSGYRNKITAARMKKEGQLAGVSDIFLPVARQGYHGLYIELKVKGGRLTEKQGWWILKVIEQGYKALVCIGWESAKKELIEYLESDI